MITKIASIFGLFICMQFQTCKTFKNSILDGINNTDACKKYCFTPKYKESVWNYTKFMKLPWLIQRDTDRAYKKFLCSNDLTLDSKFVEYKILKFEDYNEIEIYLTDTYYNVFKCEYKIHVHHKALINEHDLLSERTTDTVHFNLTTMNSSQQRVKLRQYFPKTGIYLVRIIFNTVDFEYEIGGYLINLTVSDVRTEGYERGLVKPAIYLYEHIDYLIVSNNMATIRVFVSNDFDEKESFQISYMLKDTESNITFHNYINNNNSRFIHHNNKILNGVTEIQFNITKLLENNVYRLRILGSNFSNSLSSMSDLISFRTLKTPKLTIKLLENKTVFASVEIKCQHYIYNHNNPNNSEINVKGLSNCINCMNFSISWNEGNKATTSLDTLNQEIFYSSLSDCMCSLNNTLDIKGFYYRNTIPIKSLIPNRTYVFGMNVHYYTPITVSTNKVKFQTPNSLYSENNDLSSVFVVIAITLSGLFFFISIAVTSAFIYMKFKKSKSPILLNLQEIPLTMSDEYDFQNILLKYYTEEDIKLLKTLEESRIVLVKRIGSGTFGDVYYGKLKNEKDETERNVAIKVFKTLKPTTFHTEKLDLVKEAIAMSLLKHDNLVEFYGICFDCNMPKYIVLEYMNMGDLLSYLRKHRNMKVISYTKAIEICISIAKGCEFLSENKIVHRDLAARNCLVATVDGEIDDDDGTKKLLVKIGDFGLARDIYSNDYYRHNVRKPLPVRWMSPESLIDSVSTTYSDIWSYGIVVWEIMSMGQQPYHGYDNREVIEYIKNGGTPSFPHECPLEMSNIMLKCWNMIPQKRPNFKLTLSELNHIYTKQMNSNQIIFL